ncbi:MAG: hypothetical protein OHK0029_13430 [Armatimonadaceae bacterium]
MIRTAFPISRVKQIQLRFESLTRRTRRTLEERRRTLRTSAQPAPQTTLGHDDYLMLRWREEVAQKRTDFNTFYDRYDDLVGLLCIAAQEGTTPKREDIYRQHRAWFLKNYAQVRRELHRHSQTDLADFAPGMWGRRSCDAFEALFLPSSIKALLKADDGNLIQRLFRTQEAIAAWEKALEKAEAAVRENSGQ